MSWLKASIATATAQIVRMLGGLIVIKIIAVYLGPEGFGRLGHFMSLIAILSVLAGGGILNGIVKHVAEYKNTPSKLYPFLSNALAYSLIFSLCIFIVIAVLAKSISLILFGSDEFYRLIIILGVLQFLYAMVTYCNGTINGLRETRIFAKIIIIGTLIGVPSAYVLVVTYGFTGAVIGLAIINASMLLPAAIEFMRLGYSKKIRCALNLQDVASLSKFSVMQLFSLATLPVAEIYIRGMIVHDAGWQEAGLWQSLMRLSAVYVGFFTTFLAAYYLPTLSGMVKKKEVVGYVIRYVIASGSVFIIIGTLVYVCRDFVLSVIFTKEFVIPSEYVRFQLIGDLFKIMAYVIGFLLVAKAKAKLYIYAEILQTAIYLGVTTWLVKVGEISKVFPAYALSNLMYFSFCVLGLWWFQRLPTKHKLSQI